MNKLKLKRPSYFNARNGWPWTSCAPFVDNRRALLIHRPMRVTTWHSPRDRHFSVENYCGNTHNGDPEVFTFLDSLNGTVKLLCAKCEANATAQGLPSADELTGHHVHRGRIVPIQTCCKQEDK